MDILDDEIQKKIEKRQIKHISISGGAAWGFSAYGVLHEAIKTGFLNVDDIQTLFVTSVGAMIGIMVTLKLDISIMIDYLIKRPWEVVCKDCTFSILDIYQNRGIFNKKFIEEFFKPLFKSVDLHNDITMIELYEFTGVELHVYTVEINEFVLIDISHKTHPEWKVIDAVYASCTLPILFSPLLQDNKCYLDGGIIMNNPVIKCIEHVKQMDNGNLDEILSITIKPFDIHNNFMINENINIMNFTFILIFKFLKNIRISLDNCENIKYTIVTDASNDIDYIISVITNSIERKKLVDNGIDEIRKQMDCWFSIIT